jgi:hypothetical protein
MIRLSLYIYTNTHTYIYIYIYIYIHKEFERDEIVLCDGQKRNKQIEDWKLGYKEQLLYILFF